MRAVELVLILLAVAAALHLLAERCGIPRPALLVLGGLLLAVTPGLPVVGLPPEVVFLIFVPPLIYVAAFDTSYRDFRRNLGVIARMGVLLVLATMCVVAVAAHALVREMTWGAAFALGAIVSPPDAVAVGAVTRRLGVPKIVTTLLDGESLLNDATAFVAYRMAVAGAVAGTFSLWAAGLRFVLTGAGAITLGLCRDPRHASSAGAHAPSRHPEPRPPPRRQGEAGRGERASEVRARWTRATQRALQP